jgi:hypothetical protein
MPDFSSRYGHTPSPPVQTTDLDEPTRASLWNIVYAWISRMIVRPPASITVDREPTFFYGTFFNYFGQITLFDLSIEYPEGSICCRCLRTRL